MTAPKPPTALEMREAFADRARWGADALKRIDDIIAAARAEAAAEWSDDAAELREALHSMAADPDDPMRPHVNDIVGACIRNARAEAAAPLEARVKELTEALVEIAENCGWCSPELGPCSTCVIARAALIAAPKGG